MHRISIRHHTKIPAGQTKRSRRPKQARWRSLQDTMHMWQSLHQGDRTTHAGEMKEQTGIYDSHALRIPRSQNMPTEPDTSRFGTKPNLLTKKAIGTQGK